MRMPPNTEGQATIKHGEDLDIIWVVEIGHQRGIISPWQCIPIAGQ